MHRIYPDTIMMSLSQPHKRKPSIEGSVRDKFIHVHSLQLAGDSATVLALGITRFSFTPE